MKMHTMTIKQVGISWAKVAFITILLIFIHTAKADFSDDFSSGTLDAGWRFYDPYDTDAIPGNELGESTLTHTGQNLLINIPQGLTHDLWATPKNKAPRLLQNMSNIDFDIEVKFETEPNTETQQQGIIVQQSDTIFLRFNIHYTSSEPRLFIGFINGNSGSALKSIALNAYPKYQNVIRSGNQWTYRYSSDGTNWTTAAIVNQSLTVTEVGFFAGTSSSNPAFLSSVDYFIDSTDPITDTDVWLAPAPVINAWYDYAGSSRNFGLPGTSQQQANILGNVFSDIDITTLTYNINGVLEQSLPKGPNNFRLEKKGDFNIDIDPVDLSLGSNSVEIKATDTNGLLTTKIVNIDYSSGTEWPLPYVADWGSLTDVQNVENIAHIVDGLWKLTPNGIRTVQNGYDRTIAIGDTTWSTDYEVTVPITVHSGFTGIGIAVGWQGHEATDLGMSPTVGWPLQALAWVRGPISNSTLEIITYGGLPANTWEVTETPDPQHSISIAKDTTYILKTRSESMVNGMSKFYVKFWPENSVEPSTWNINADIPTRDGSVLLVAFNVDATFGNVSIEPLTVVADTTPPVIDNIQVTVTDTTATITWDTNEVADSLVDYGSDTNYGSMINNTSFVTSHALTLTNLTASTDYHFRVSSTDGSSNTISSVDMTLTTAAPDTTTPTISNIQTTVTDTTATITWDTNEIADSLVDYGPDNTYGLVVTNATPVTSHSLTLTNLTADTTYHYQVSSADGSFNVASSIDLTLTTNSMPNNLSGMVSDDFDGALNTGLWTFYDPLGDSTLSTTGTHVSISVPEGISHDLWKDALDAPRIRQAANDTDFEVEVKFDSPLTTKYQINGITVEQDLTNLLRFDFYSNGSATYIFSTSFDNGKPSIHTNSIIIDSAPLYLRVTRVGDQWTMSYSYDGSSWTAAGVYTHNLSVTSVGLFAGNAGSTPPDHTALIDYFMVAGLPPDTSTDSISPTISNVQTTVTDTTATITWDTNEVADSLVDYGLTSAYDSTVNDATLVTSHSLILTGLTADTEYHYQISSVDDNANAASSLDLTLTTDSNTSPDTTDTITWDSNWGYRVSLTVNSGDYERFNRPVEVAIDFTSFLAPADLLTNFDVNSIRIHEVDVTGEFLLTENISFQFDPAEGFNALSNANGTLVFLLGGNTAIQTDRYFQVYFDVEGGGHTAPVFTNQVNVTDNIIDEGQSSFLINTLNADYYYQKQAGGFSSIIDDEQHDWINYQSVSAGLPGAASYFRGIPNLVYPEGHFHPGATSSISTLIHEGPLKATIKSITMDGWEVQWEFFPQFARMSVISAVENYWFLYEGTPGGVLGVEDYVVRSDGTETPYTTAWTGDIPNQEWVYFSDTQVNKSIFLAHHNDDTGTDSYFQLNNLMTVFGFGRQNLNKFILPEPHQFTIGLTDSTDFGSTSTTIESAYKDVSVIISPVAQYDTEAPSVPTGLIEDSATENTVIISWNASTDTQGVVVSYRIFREDTEVGTSTTTSFTDTTVQADQTYQYSVSAIDDAGNESISSTTLQVITPSSSDTEAASVTISNIQTTVTDTTATITWDTDKASDSLVDYGLTNAYDSTVSDGTFVTSHSLTLTELTADTEYHYQLSSIDGNTNSASSVDAVFTTVDTLDNIAPVISNVQTTVTDTTATITWDTDEISDSLVDYGLTNAYDSTVSDGTFVTSHSLTLTELTADTEYHYQLSSIDGNTNIANSIEMTLITNSTSSSLSGLVSDNFDGALDTNIWTFDDLIGDSTLLMTGTQVSISVPAGSSHDPWKNTLDTAPRIRQVANDTDFEIEVKFDSALLNKYQLQGITVEQDSTNLLRFDFYSDGSVTRIFSAGFVNGNPSIHVNSTIINGVPLYLRVTRIGDQWTTSYSYDGSSWTVAGVYIHNLSVTSVGLFSGNAGSTPPDHTTLIDYFMVDGLSPMESDQ